MLDEIQETQELHDILTDIAAAKTRITKRPIPMPRELELAYQHLETAELFVRKLRFENGGR